MELRNRLTEATGLNLTASLVFDYPSPTALAGYLGSELAPSDTPSDTGRPLPLLDELSRLEKAVAVARPGGGERAAAVRRLHALLDALDAGLDGEEEGESVSDRIDAASVEDILDFIDKDLGRSPTDHSHAPERPNPHAQR